MLKKKKKKKQILATFWPRPSFVPAWIELDEKRRSRVTSFTCQLTETKTGSLISLRCQSVSYRNEFDVVAATRQYPLVGVPSTSKSITEARLPSSFLSAFWSFIGKHFKEKGFAARRNLVELRTFCIL